MNKRKKWFWGLYFLIAAVAVILNQMDYFNEFNYLSLVFIILMIPIIIKSLVNFNWAGVLFPIAILLIIFDESLGLGSISVWPVLIAALFGSIGLSFIFSPRIKALKINNEGFDKLENIQDDEVVYCNVSFGSTIKYVNSDNYKKGNFKCSFGAMKIYFDNTKLNKNVGVLNLDVSFGGVEIFVPKEWQVINNCHSSMGGVDEKNNHASVNEKSPKLILTGNVSLGGVEIIYI